MFAQGGKEDIKIGTELVSALSSIWRCFVPGILDRVENLTAVVVVVCIFRCIIKEALLEIAVATHHPATPPVPDPPPAKRVVLGLSLKPFVQVRGLIRFCFPYTKPPASFPIVYLTRSSALSGPVLSPVPVFVLFL